MNPIHSNPPGPKPEVLTLDKLKANGNSSITISQWFIYYLSGWNRDFRNAVNVVACCLRGAFTSEGNSRWWSNDIVSTLEMATISILWNITACIFMALSCGDLRE
jgi:hypothetical protein